MSVQFTLPWFANCHFLSSLFTHLIPTLWVVTEGLRLHSVHEGSEGLRRCLLGASQENFLAACSTSILNSTSSQWKSPQTSRAISPPKCCRSPVSQALSFPSEEKQFPQIWENRAGAVAMGTRHHQNGFTPFTINL